MELQYRSAGGALNPDLSTAWRLERNPCAEGVSVTLQEGHCIIAVS